MDAFNNWLNEIQHNGQGLELYNRTGTVCLILLILGTLLCIWWQKLNPIKGIVISYLAYTFLGYAQHLMTWFQRDFEWNAYIGTANIGMGFILLPLICWLGAITFNVNKDMVGELVAVSNLAWHWVGRSGCTFSGCCYGIPCAWGIYSHYPDGNTFPVCWVESLGTLAILIFLLVRLFRRQRGTSDNDRALPYTLLFYGAMRMVTEFLRYHASDSVWFGFLPQTFVLALIMALVGGYLLYASISKEKAAAASAEPELPELSGQRR